MSDPAVEAVHRAEDRAQGDGLGRRRDRPGVPDPWSPVAALGLIAIGLDVRFALGLSTALVVGAFWSPVWSGVLRRYTGAWTTVLLGVGALLCGAGLAIVSAVDHDWSASVAVQTALLFVGAITAIGFVLWARCHLDIWQVALSYAVGSGLAGLVVAAAEDNPWKGALSWPVTLAALVVACRGGRRAPQFVVVGLLAVMNGVFDFRSQMALCLVVMALLVWQRPGHRARRVGVGVPATLVLLAAAVSATYILGTALLVGGYAGEQLQTRSETQIQQSGNLLIGGRPEWMATVALMAESPAGFGVGVVPNASDIAVAKAGLAGLNIPTIGGYAENYMFSQQFKLHSVVADLWSLFGIVGLALGLMWCAMLVHQLVRRVAWRRADSLFLMVCLTALWHLAFSPVYSNLMDVAFSVGFVLPLSVAVAGHDQDVR